MHCREAQRLIARRIDDDISGRELIALERHISECPDCSVLALDLGRIVGGLRNLPSVRAPESFAEAVDARIRAEAGVRRRQPWALAHVGAWRLRLATAAFVVLFGVATAWWANLRAREELRRAQFVEHTATTTSAQAMAVAASDPLDDVAITNSMQHGSLAYEANDAL